LLLLETGQARPSTTNQPDNTMTTLINKKTQQECKFEDQAAADNFLKDVAHPKEWAAAADETPAEPAAE
jgi:hypothetical protein